MNQSPELGTALMFVPIASGLPLTCKAGMKPSGPFYPVHFEGGYSSFSRGKFPQSCQGSDSVSMARKL